MHSLKQSLLETNPRWLSMTFMSSAAALVVTGVGWFFGLADSVTIGPFTLLLHLVWATTLSAWILNLKTKIQPEKKALIGIGAAIAAGSLWSSLQQWFAYVGSGTVNDIVLVAGAMIMDAAGGALTYTLYHLNILKK
jgi:hypothetical protein